MKGSQRAGLTQNGHSKTQRVPPPNQGITDRPIRIRANERDSRPFPFPMYKMDGTPNRDAPIHRHPQKQYLLLPGRKDTTRRRKVDAQYRSRPNNDTIRNGHKPTRHKPTADEPNNHLIHYTNRAHIYHLVPPTADAISAAEDRTLNTWRTTFKPVY